MLFKKLFCLCERKKYARTLEGRINEPTDRQTDKQIDESTNQQTDKQMDEKMDKHTNETRGLSI